jgi:carbon-monoxide dehydrogenase medium subunit
MKPPVFEYAAPESVAETVALLEHNAGSAAILAGGQSLVPALNFRLGAPSILVDINGVEGLGVIEPEGDALRIGAMARHRDAIVSPLVCERCPLFAAAVRHIGHAPIRNRGTVGGSVAHADPAAEIPAVLAALGGTIELTSPRGSRTTRIEEYVLGPYFTTKMPDELVTAIRLPPGGAAWGFHEIARRPGDFALAGAVAILETDADVVRGARVALFGTEPAPRRVPEIEEALSGASRVDAAATAADATRAAELEIFDDPQVAADYRRELAAVAVGRAVADAVSRGAAS